MKKAVLYLCLLMTPGIVFAQLAPLVVFSNVSQGIVLSANQSGITATVTRLRILGGGVLEFNNGFNVFQNGQGIAVNRTNLVLSLNAQYLDGYTKDNIISEVIATVESGGSDLSELVKKDGSVGMTGALLHRGFRFNSVDSGYIPPSNSMDLQFGSTAARGIGAGVQWASLWGSQTSRVGGTGSSIVGAHSSINDGNWSSMSGGISNTVEAGASRSFIGGGLHAVLRESASNSVLLGVHALESSARYSVAAGSHGRGQNTMAIGPNAEYSVMMGSSNTMVFGAFSTIINSRDVTAFNVQRSLVVGALSSTITSDNESDRSIFVLGGDSVIATGSRMLLSGSAITAAGTNLIVLGNQVAMSGRRNAIVLHTAADALYTATQDNTIYLVATNVLIPNNLTVAGATASVQRLSAAVQVTAPEAIITSMTADLFGANQGVFSNGLRIIDGGFTVTSTANRASIKINPGSDSLQLFGDVTINGSVVATETAGAVVEGGAPLTTGLRWMPVDENVQTNLLAVDMDFLVTKQQVVKYIARIVAELDEGGGAAIITTNTDVNAGNGWQIESPFQIKAAPQSPTLSVVSRWVSQDEMVFTVWRRPNSGALTLDPGTSDGFVLTGGANSKFTAQEISTGSLSVTGSITIVNGAGRQFNGNIGGGTNLPFTGLRITNSHGGGVKFLASTDGITGYWTDPPEP